MTKHTYIFINRALGLTALYAHDLPLYVQDPVRVVPRLKLIFQEFGGRSGLEINWIKSYALPIGHSLDQSWLGMQVVGEEGSLDLGVRVTVNPVHYMKENLKPLLNLKKKLNLEQIAIEYDQ